MKRIIYTLLCLTSMVAMQSCINDEFEQPTTGGDSDYISIDITTLGLKTRAIEDTPLEAAVSHLDVLIFEEDGAYKYSERINVSGSAGTVNLKTKRRDVFDVNAKYYVIVVANSTYDEAVFSNLSNMDALHALKQTDERIHITGSSVDDAPQSFLMDGNAFLKGGVQPAKPTPIVLFNGVDKEKTELKVNLARAAAKVVVKLKKGDAVTFVENEHYGYYLRNLPYSTSVIPLANDTDKPNPALRTPDKTTGRYFEWSASEVTITAYLYSHSWEGNEFFGRGTSLIVNIPVVYEGMEFENSYYQIALRRSDDLNFERNHQYTITGVINAPGAEEVSKPTVIDELKYEAREWDVVEVDVNGENAPTYLSVNREVVEMHNVATDAKSLMFSSSSPVTVTISDVHYIDKFGQKQTISANGISAVAATGISGGITINSPLPTNNTIRYFTLTVRNQEGIERQVVVEQYPLTYITNQQGYYSYRSDFKTTSSRPTTYKYKGDAIVGVSLKTSGSLGNSDWNGEYSYENTNAGFWRSKVVTRQLSSGKSDIAYYYYGNNSNTPSTRSAQTGGNARMYHVRTTATSAEFNLGRPRLDANGYTNSGADNAKLVSPSFMIASRLGFINSGSGNINYANTDAELYELYSHHCNNYVEVYVDDNGQEVHLDDWRLPTEAELQIIMDLQGGSNENADAIDYLLNAEFYMSASGKVFNSKNDSDYNESQAERYGSTAGRCVRDVYDK